MSERADLAELEELRQENADLTEKINQLEVCVGQLLKEIKFMRNEILKIMQAVMRRVDGTFLQDLFH